MTESVDWEQGIGCLELSPNTHGMLRMCGVFTIEDAVKAVLQSKNDGFGESMVIKELRESLEKVGVNVTNC